MLKAIFPSSGMREGQLKWREEWMMVSWYNLTGSDKVCLIVHSGNATERLPALCWGGCWGPAPPEDVPGEVLEKPKPS